jgi:alanine dehydrogenase
MGSRPEVACREVLILTRSEVASALDPLALLDAVSGGFQALSAGTVSAPPRAGVSGDGGSVLTMAGRSEPGPIVVKLVGVFPGNPASGLESHQATICLFDATTGVCLAVMDGEHITAVRTAAASALVVRACARSEASVLAVVGSGVQARAHLEYVPLVHAFASVRLVSRDPSAPARLGVEAGTVEGADVICLTTGSSSPVLLAGDVAPGAVVTSVGYAPPGGELDPELARVGRLIVETRAAFAPPPAGCAELAGLDPASAFELGEVLSGVVPGRADDSEIVVYKAAGHVVEDAVAAELAYRVAVERGLGREVAL